MKWVNSCVNVMHSVYAKNPVIADCTVGFFAFTAGEIIAQVYEREHCGRLVSLLGCDMSFCLMFVCLLLNLQNGAGRFGDCDQDGVSWHCNQWVAFTPLVSHVGQCILSTNGSLRGGVQENHCRSSGHIAIVHQLLFHIHDARGTTHLVGTKETRNSDEISAQIRARIHHGLRDLANYQCHDVPLRPSEFPSCLCRPGTVDLAGVPLVCANHA